MRAAVDDCLSIQVQEDVHEALQVGTAAIIYAGAALGKSLTLHTHASAESHFQLGFHAALSETAIGIVAGVEVAIRTTPAFRPES